MDLVSQTFESILDDFTFTNETKEIYQLIKSLNETNSCSEKL
jgi:hypothetical protein